MSLADKTGTELEQNDVTSRDQRITIRLTSAEYQMLEDKAIKSGLPLSRYCVRLLYENSVKTLYGRDSNAEEKDIKKQLNLTLKSVRESYKSIAADYNGIASKVVAILRDKDTCPAFEISLRRDFKSLQEMTLELQRALNRILRDNGEKQEMPVAKVSLPANGNEDIFDKLTNMERICITGHLEDDAIVYKSKDGNEKLRMKVICKSADKSERTYTVFFGKTDRQSFLKKGTGVFAEGRFIITEKNELLVMADVLTATIDQN